MKRLLLTAFTIACLSTAQYGAAKTWSDLSPKETAAINRSISTLSRSMPQAQFQDQLTNIYTMYGDPNMTPAGRIFLQNINAEWRDRGYSGTAPDYSTYLSSTKSAGAGATGAPAAGPAVPGVTVNAAGDLVSNGVIIARWNGSGYTPVTTGTSGAGSGSGIAPAPGNIPTPPPLPAGWNPLAGGTGTGTARTLTFAQLAAEAKKLKPEPTDLEKFWRELSLLTSDALCTFNIKKEVLVQELRKVTPVPTALITDITSLPQETDKSGRPVDTYIKNQKPAYRGIIQDLLAVSPMTYFNLATGPIAKMMQALYYTSLPAGDFATNPKIQEFKDDMSDFIIKDPRAYTIKGVSAYMDCIDRIPDGDFRTTFRSTLKQTLDLAKAMQFAKNNPINVAPLLPYQQKAQTDVQAFNDELVTAELEIKAGTLSDADAVTRLQPFYEDAKKSVADLNKETGTVFGAHSTTIKGLISTIKAKAPNYAPGLPVKQTTAALSTELADYMTRNPIAPTGPTTPGRVPVPTPGGPAGPGAPSITTAALGMAGSQFPLEAPIDYAGLYPFARVTQSPVCIKENGNTVDSSLNTIVRVGILKENYDRSPQGKTLLINAAGGYDLYVWGPAVADYTRDMCVDRRTLEQNVRGTATFSIAVRFQNFGTAIPLKSTKLYKIASKSRQEILDIGALAAIDLDTANKTDLDSKIKYLYQKTLKQEDYRNL